MRCDECGVEHGTPREVGAGGPVQIDIDGHCQSCSFWLVHVANAELPVSVRVDGQHYRVGDEGADRRGFRGCGGARFRISFNNGSCIDSTNLWCQGAIPHRFRDRLPDNAVFLPC